ncbi:MAG: Uma2 family endonuclease [Verrucomicrobiales bacterium]|jgi:Uma2 family endonuclease
MNAVLERKELSDYEKERGKPMPSRQHGLVQMQLGGQWITNSDFQVQSEVTLELAERPNLTPDLSVFPRKTIDWRHDEIRVSEPPIMVVEILSPTQGSFELMQRIDRYFNHGVKSCWVVYPTSRSLTIYTAEGSEKTVTVDDKTATDPATGLTADLGIVFS